MEIKEYKKLIDKATTKDELQNITYKCLQEKGQTLMSSKYNKVVDLAIRRQISLGLSEVVMANKEFSKELKKDLDEALEYISMVVSNGDITECGVAHLYKKYYPEEYEEELKNKEE